MLISPIVESLPGDAKASAMSLLHSFYCWGQMLVVIVTTVLVRLLGANHWYILPFLWALIPATNFFRFTKVPLRVLVPEEQQMPIRELFRSPSFLIALLLMLSAGASELTMSQWSSYFAEQGLQVPKMIGDLIGPGLFALFMGIGRTIYGVWGERIDLRKALLFTSALCVLCYLLTVFAPHPLLSLAGCSLTGFSVSLMWPGTFSLSARAFPFGGTAMFGILAIFGDLGGSLGPWSAGLVADLTERGLHAGLLTASVFPLALLIGVQLFSPKKGHERKQSLGPSAWTQAFLLCRSYFSSTNCTFTPLGSRIKKNFVWGLGSKGPLCTGKPFCATNSIIFSTESTWKPREMESPQRQSC